MEKKKVSGSASKKAKIRLAAGPANAVSISPAILC